MASDDDKPGDDRELPETIRRRLESLVPELVKKTFAAGMGAVFSTEEGIRKLARESFHGMLVYQAKMERKQGFLFRCVDIVMELFAISASVSRARRMLDDRHPDSRQLGMRDREGGQDEAPGGVAGEAGQLGADVGRRPGMQEAWVAELLDPGVDEGDAEEQPQGQQRERRRDPGGRPPRRALPSLAGRPRPPDRGCVDVEVLGHVTGGIVGAAPKPSLIPS